MSQCESVTYLCLSATLASAIFCILLVIYTHIKCPFFAQLHNFHNIFHYKSYTRILCQHFGKHIMFPLAIGCTCIYNVHVCAHVHVALQIAASLSAQYVYGQYGQSSERLANTCTAVNTGDVHSTQSSRQMPTAWTL